MKIRPTAMTNQPDWVCEECGVKWGLWWDGSIYKGPTPHCATWHQDQCGVCGQTNAVTEARDFGYLRAGWEDKKIVK